MIQRGTLGWGVVGIGGIVRGTIAPAMLAEATCDLVAGVSRDRARAEHFAAEFGARRAYTDYAMMLDDPEVDAVYIATPNALHAGQVVAAAGAGKHVLCDKPLAINVPDAAQAVQACADAGVKLGITFHNRFLPWVRDVSRMIGGGVIGDVQVVHIEVGSGTRHYDNWRSDPAMAGLGSVHNVGAHPLDGLRLILHAEPLEVTAMFDRSAGSNTVEMLGLMLIRFDNGVLVYVNCNETIAHPRNDITIYGSAGRIVGTGFTRSRESGDLHVLTDAGETTMHYPAVAAHRALVAAFTDAVLRDEEPSPSGVDGLRSAQLCEAIGRSVDERRVVEVDYDAGAPGSERRA